MPEYLSFPDGGEELVEAIDSAVALALKERNTAAIEWQTALLYMQGHRRFFISDWEHGDVQIPYENEDGELEFKLELLLQQFQVQLGRILQLPVNPVVGKGDEFSLDAVRKAGMGQAVVNYMVSRLGTLSLKMIFAQLAECVLLYGLGGLYHYRTGREGDDIGKRTAIDVVPPWEILPIPADPMSRIDVQGITRRRKVPLDWLRAYLPALPRDESDLRVEERGYGESPSHTNEYGSAPIGGEGQRRRRQRELETVSRSRKSKSVRRTSRGMQPWVIFEETWLHASKGLVGRYIMKVGDWCVSEEYEDPIVSPISLARYIPIGFYGRSYVGYLMSQNIENERMAANQFQNVADLDIFGTTFYPMNMGINKRAMESPGRRKQVPYAPNPTLRGDPIINIAPPNVGDFPGKILGMGIELQKLLSGQGEMYSGDAPGRADSLPGLSMINEVGNTGLVATTAELGNCFAQIYRSLLQAASAEKGEGASIRMTILDDRVLGVKVDTSTGAISLDDNPIPEPHEVEVDIAARALPSQAQTKQEMLTLVAQGGMSWTEFRIANERKGLGFPFADRGDYEAWRKAVIQKIILFNDGQTPGPILGGREYDRPHISLPVIMELMCSIEFSLATPEVREAFIQWKTELEAMIGQFPDPLPGPGQWSPQSLSQQQGQPQLQSA